MYFSEQVEQIIGIAPQGYEPLGYIINAIIFIFILFNIFLLIGGIIKKVGNL